MGTAIVIIVFALVVGLFFVSGNIERSIEHDMTAVADISDELITTKINLLKADASTAAEVIVNADPEDIQAALEGEVDKYPDFMAITYIGPNGIIASSGNSPTPADLFRSEYIQSGFRGESVISTSRIDPSGELVFHVVVPAGDGVLSVTIPGMYFSDVLKDFKIWETGNIFIVDAQGTVMANVRPEWVLERYNFITMARSDSQYERIGAVISEMIKGEPGVGRFSVGGAERVCIYQPIEGSKVGWTIGVAAPLDESPLGNVQNGLMIVGLVCFVLCLVAAIASSYSIGKPYIEINRLVVSLEEQSEDLVQAREEAIASAAAKSDFLANMSHEMRTPLNAIIGLSELTLNEDEVGETPRKNLEKVYNSGVTLLSLINDILDISKIESGKFELIPERYDIPSLINDTATLNIVRIGSKPIEFILDVDENLPSALIGDELRLKQVFNNLLSNAFKYTEEGSVIWSLSCERDGDDVWLNSSIKDTGFGIREDDLAKLFSEYNQVDTKSNRKIEGTGLGLSICKSMVELMEGTVSVESEYGKGSTFSVRLKQKKVSDVVIGPEIAENLRSFNFSDNRRDRSAKLVRAHIPYARVLIVDDVETNLDVARGIMKPYGMQIDCVTSGFAAVDLIRSAEVQYNAIFMDHMMPGMDGIEATRIIREEIGTEYARNVPIIALTANAIVGNEEMFLSHGFQAFLSKPIDIMRMDHAINHWVRDKELERQLVNAEAESSEETAERRSGEDRRLGERRSGEDRRASVANKIIEGLDIEEGLSRFGDDEEVYFEVLQSYAKNTPPLLDRLESFPEDALSDYSIVVHGLKSSSRSIGADGLGDLAESLEHAAKEGDGAFVKANSSDFIHLNRELLASLSQMLQENEETNRKPQRPEPDPTILANLLEAAKSFDIDGVDEAMEELNRYSYEFNGELVEWLKSQVEIGGFKKIQERLSD
jgi:signal transduction histidine kinase/DNA-binding NarL/FixJ family response regulator/HPt (histidine-containing phosphotransfer) domain-containing protein